VFSMILIPTVIGSLNSAKRLDVPTEALCAFCEVQTDILKSILTKKSIMLMDYIHRPVFSCKSRRFGDWLRFRPQVYVATST
jgi:hypothetical protein